MAEGMHCFFTFPTPQCPVSRKGKNLNPGGISNKNTTKKSSVAIDKVIGPN